MINGGDYEVPSWLREKDDDSIQAFLDSLGGFISDGLEDTAQGIKSTLAIPFMLHNIMLAEIMQVGLLQRQNDMIGDSQEASVNDLVSTILSTVTTAQALTPVYNQSMIIRSMFFAVNTACVFTIYATGPKFLGQNLNLFQSKLSANTPVPMTGLAQVLPAGSQLFCTCSVSSAVYFNADIRPIVRYKDSMFRTQQSRLSLNG